MSTTQTGQTDTRAEETQAYPADKAELINYLFASFKTFWPLRYASMFKTVDDVKNAKRAWLTNLPMLRNAHIRFGLLRCQQELSWPPSMKEFLERCRPTTVDLGLPSPSAAYREACNRRSPKAAQKWSHPVVYHAGVEIGWHYLSTTEERFAFPAFKEVYERMVDDLLLGNADAYELPVARETKKAQSQKRYLTKAENSEKLKSIRAILD